MSATREPEADGRDVLVSSCGGKSTYLSGEGALRNVGSIAAAEALLVNETGTGAGSSVI